jgi:nitrogen-specific signal transduction histidine kinase/ActR/RegA family two-component response regulator
MVVSSSLIEFQGQPAVLCISRDVTEQRLLERQLLHAQKMEAIGQLAGGIAHDFNNILQALLATLATVRVSRGDPARVAHAIDEIEANVKRGASVVQQLLLFARREVSRRERLDLAAVVHAAGALVRRLVPANVSFAAELERPGPVVEIDRGQIEQVLVNLVINAVDAMPEGGELVTSVSVAEDGNACLAVRDTGHGMSAELVSRVFEPFFTTKSPDKGTGLGLAVVHGIVASHGGRVDVESRPGAGTTVTILLPRVASEPSSVAVDREEELPTGSGQRILLVEDQEETRQGLKELLTVLGYACEAARDAETAETLAGVDRFDVLLTDLMLPGQSGHELAGRLQRRWPELRVILMSGYAQDEAVRRGVTLGSIRFLQKPFDMSTLAQALRAALASSRTAEGGTPEGAIAPRAG